VCRLIAADVLMGMPYSIEELDHGSDTADDKPATVRRRRTAEPAPEVERPPLPEPAETVDTATGEIQVEDPPADALLADEPEGWR
jgi:hypothetical protein